METKHQVHNLIILDESGSMETIKQPVISGFNELVQTIKGAGSRYPEQEHFISFVSFNGAGIKTLHWKQPVAQLPEINAALYQPRENTPLFDAMGETINKLKNELSAVGPHHVLVTIFTDGEENASIEYSAQHIKLLVETLRTQQWTFTYIGTDHNVESVTVSIGINNTMNFEKNSLGITGMFEKEKHARLRYLRDIHYDLHVESDYYRDLDDKQPSSTPNNS